MPDVYPVPAHVHDNSDNPLRDLDAWRKAWLDSSWDPNGFWLDLTRATPCPAGPSPSGPLPAKTRSGKVMRRILRKVAEGNASELGDVSTLADPGVVEAIVAGAVRE